MANPSAEAKVIEKLQQTIDAQGQMLTRVYRTLD